MSHLFQTETWVDRDKVEHKLADMDESYRANLLLFLRARARNLLHAESVRATQQWEVHDGGDMANDALANTAHELTSLWLRSATEPRVAKDWLESTPFVKELRRSLGEDVDAPPEKPKLTKKEKRRLRLAKAWEEGVEDALAYQGQGAGSPPNPYLHTPAEIALFETFFGTPPVVRTSHRSLT